MAPSASVRVSYDDAGLTQTVTDAVGVKTRAEFDVLGRVVKESGLSKRAENGGYVLRENSVTTVYTYDYMGTVSYTHLDVYKRQDLSWRREVGGIQL